MHVCTHTRVQSLNLAVPYYNKLMFHHVKNRHCASQINADIECHEEVV